VRLKPGDYVAVTVTGGTMASLAATPLARTTLREFYGGAAGALLAADAAGALRRAASV
jgi:hypothetical protein